VESFRNFLLVLLLCCGMIRGQAESIILVPVADATLIEASPQNSSGGAIFFNSGTTQNRTRNRALLQFDVAAQLPADAQITSATLRLEVTRQPADGFESSAFTLRRMLVSWGEGDTVPTDNAGGLGAPASANDATWTHRFAGTGLTWAAPGGLAGTDFASDPSSTALIYGPNDSPYFFESTLDTVADAQSWLTNPEANYGWMLLSEAEDLPFTARRFGSSEDATRSPQLVLEYTIVPEPGTLVLLVCGGVFCGLLARRRDHGYWRR
jgi:hypothetical protein